MSRRVKVAMFQTARPIEIDADATHGAVIGRNVWLTDGTLYDPTASGGIAPPGHGEGVVYWRTIMEIPPNVNSVAGLGGTGFVRRSGPDSWSASGIVNADLSGANTDGLSEGAGNLYFTGDRARAAAVADQIDPLTDDVAPSQRAVAEALDGVVGQPGPPGKDGQIRFTGNGPPGTIVGAEPGDTYMDIISGDIYKLT